MKTLKTAILSTAAALVCFTGVSAATETITLWDFQDYYYDNVLMDWVVTPTYTPSIGSGTWEAQGTAVWDPDQEDHRDPTNPDELNSSSDPIHLINEFMGYALDFDQAPAQGTGNKTSGVRFNVSTVNYENIILSFDVRLKYRSPRHWRLQYTADGSTWIDSILFEANNPNQADHFHFWGADLSSITDINDNPNFGFRLVAEFGPSGGYEAAHKTSVFRQRDLLRVDMVRVSGTVVPEPSSVLVLLTGAAGFAGMALRRKS